jgi:hypothetical protein
VAAKRDADASAAAQQAAEAGTMCCSTEERKKIALHFSSNCLAAERESLMQMVALANNARTKALNKAAAAQTTGAFYDPQHNRMSVH